MIEYEFKEYKTFSFPKKIYAYENEIWTQGRIEKPTPTDFIFYNLLVWGEKLI